MQKIKVLTGTMLALVLSAISVYPAVAHTIRESESGQLLSQTNSVENAAQAVKGTIKSINGDVITLQLMDGTTRDVTLPAGEIARLNLQAGKQISVTLDDQNLASNVSVINTSTTSTDAVTVNQTHREQVIQRRRVVRVKPAPVQTPSTQVQEQPIQSTPTEQPTAGVRALW